MYTTYQKFTLLARICAIWPLATAIFMFLIAVCGAELFTSSSESRFVNLIGLIMETICLPVSCSFYTTFLLQSFKGIKRLENDAIQHRFTKETLYFAKLLHFFLILFLVCLCVGALLAHFDNDGSLCGNLTMICKFFPELPGSSIEGVTTLSSAKGVAEFTTTGFVLIHMILLSSFCCTRTRLCMASMAVCLK